MSPTPTPTVPEDDEVIAPEDDIWQYMPWLREARQRIAEETRGMSPEEEATYWRAKHAEHEQRRAAQEQGESSG